jgi:uncharacterized protein (TIGR02145 family)
MSQLTVTEGAAMAMTPQQLVEQWLVGQGVFVSNCTFNGSSAMITSNQIGTFETTGNAVTQLGLPAGVLITSGQASLAIGPNTSPGAGAATTSGGDPDLSIIAATNTNDKCVIEFDFVPQSDTLKFRYVFGSEEFYEYCNSYNDAFGFFLSGPGITGTFSNSSVDIALMPGIPLPVTINNLCANPTSTWNNAGGIYFQYDGMSYVFTAWHVVTPCATYHIKLAVADASDNAYDSGVFLEKNSFNSTGLQVNNSYLVAKLGTKAVEGCNEVTISFILSQPMGIPYTVHYTVTGTATRGVDYPDIPDSLVIPPGQDSVAIVINPVLDGITEGVETCVLNIEQPSCSGTTIYHDSIFIFDPKVLTLVPQSDVTLCAGDSAYLISVPVGGERPLNYNWNVPLGTDTAIWVKPPPGPNLYHITVTDLCGTQAHDTIMVNVNALPHFTNTNFKDIICPGGTTNIVFHSSAPSTTYIWTAVNPGGHITGYSSGSGPTIIQTLQNITLFRDSVIYTVIPTSMGCIGGDTSFTVVVNPLPNVIISNNTPSVCDNQLINIALSSTLPGASFTWTSTCSSPFVSGYTNGSGTLIGDKLNNSGNTIDTVKYFIHATANGCNGPVSQTNVLVNPIPVITNVVLTKTICSNNSTNITLTSNVIGAGFSWTASLMAGTVTGWANGAGTLINQVLVNTGIIPGLVKYRVIPSANSCSGLPKDFDVTVNPVPLVTNVATRYPVCSGNAANIALVSNVAGTTFSWTATPSAPTLSGYTNSSGPMIGDVLVNSAMQTDSVAYVVTPVMGGCPGPPRTLYAVVYPVPNAISTPPFAAFCSGQTTAFALTSGVTGTTFSWTAVPSSGNVTGFAAGSGNSIAQTLINSGNNIETVTYTVTPVVTGCPAGASITVVATVRPVPALTNSPLSKQICDNTNTAVTLTSNVAGTLFTWTCTPSSGNVTGWANNAVPTTTLNQTLDNTGFNTEWVTYHATPAANGCSGPVTDYTVTVYPTPNLTTFPLNAGICKGQATGISLTSNVAGTLFTWTCTQVSGFVTGWSNNPGPPANAINQVLNLTVNFTDSVIYHITPQANGCFGISYDFNQRVNPVPMLITNPMWQTICSGNATSIVLAASCAGTTYSYTAAQGTGNVTGYSNGISNPIVQVLTNNLPTQGSIVYTIIPSTSTCIGNDTLFTEFVNPTPHLTNSPAGDSICNNSLFNLVLTSDVAGTQFTWTCTPSSGNVTGWANNAVPTTVLNQTLANSGSNTEWVTYHMTAIANGCPGPVTDYVVTVFPTATLTNTPATQSQCDNINTNILLASNVAGTLFTWTCTPSSGNITGWANNAVPAAMINQTLDNTGINTEWATYHVTPVVNGCPGTTSNFVVTVYPTPNLSNSPPSKSQCDNLPTGINLTSTVAGTQFTWTCTPSSASITGWSDNAVPGTLLNQTLDNTGFSTETVTYHVIPIANGCPGPVTNYVVTVYPTPNLSNAPPSLQICNNTATNLTLTSNVTGTMFTWTCTPSSANVTGWANNGVPTTLLNQTLTNLGLLTEWVTYHINPAANGCTGPVTDFTVTVVQSPDVFFNPPAQTICSQQTSAIQVLSSVPGATFTWTATPSGPTITGQSAGSGNTIAQTITNSGTTVGSVTYQVTPAAFGCPPGLTQNVVLSVDPTPVVTNAVTAFQICSAAATNIIPVSNVAASSFSWTATGSSPVVTGYSNGAGPAIVQTLTNSGTNIETVTYQVIATANGCPGPVKVFTVTVFPVPDVIFNPIGQSLCSGVTTSINMSSIVAGTSYTWTATGSAPSVTGYAPGSGNLIQQILFNSGPYPETVTYSVTPTSNGCPGPVLPVIATVNPQLAVTYTPCFDPAVSLNAQPILLRGAIPVGGAYSGAGVAGGTFFPAVAGAGSHAITYSYTNTWSCASSATATINVVVAAPFACGGVLTDLRDLKTYTTVQIGTQCWFSSNLDYGSQIASAQMQRDNCSPEKYCFGDLVANCGLQSLYQWDELMSYGQANGAQGMCPPEWHVPTETDYTTLFNFYTSNGFAGSPLKFTGFSGFNAFLSGVRFNDLQWDFNNFAVMFWSSTSHGPRKAWAHGMNTFNPSVSYYPSHRNNAFPVRCIKD